MERPTREATFLALAEVFSLRGTCPRARVGCVIVKGDHVISHGYNGAPRGLPHCDEAGCEKHSPWETSHPGCTNAVHAEENAIAYAAKMGVSCWEATLFCTHEPCLRCARLIIQAGIMQVVYRVPYRLHDGKDLLVQAGVLISWHYLDVDVNLSA